MSSKIRLPQGVADRPPARARALHEHTSAIARAFELSGYDLVDTPPFELLDVLERGLGEGAKKTLFRMVDPATGEIVVLRPDFTAQVARLVTLRMAERPRPLRLRYQGRVLRAADPLGRGLRSRELFQAGAELIGVEQAWADVEVLTLGARALEHLGRPLTIDLGHAGLIPALWTPGADADAVHAALRAKNAADLGAVAPSLAPLVDLFGGFEVLDRARALLATTPAITAALDELDRIGRALVARLPNVSVSFDLGEVRGLGYYTGPFFHGYVQGAADAVMMGGRYDGLLGRYGRPEPAVGLAIDVDALAHETDGAARPSGVVFAEPDLAAPVFLADAEALRRTGERAVLVPSGEAERYAAENGYRAIVHLDAAGARVRRPVEPSR